MLGLVWQRARNMYRPKIKGFAEYFIFLWCIYLLKEPAIEIEQKPGRERGCSWIFLFLAIKLSLKRERREITYIFLAKHVHQTTSGFRTQTSFLDYVVYT